MNDMLNSLEGFDSGSNYRFGDKMERNKNPRSLFDLSHLNTMTIDNAGLLVPIALWQTIPSDDFDINVDCLLRVMPQVVPLYSRQRLFIYGFYSRYSDLWENWQVFMDKGYTGNVEKKIPYLHVTGLQGNSNFFFESNETVQPNSLFDYMGLPIGAEVSANLEGASISALPFMMYLRIYRDYFMNKNEWINDRVLLPDNDANFRLDDNGHVISAAAQSKYIKFGQSTDIIISGNDYKVGLLYHDYPDDYFTSALPFTQRGTAPQLQAFVDPSDITATTKTSLSNSMRLLKYVSSLSEPPIDAANFYHGYDGGYGVPFAYVGGTSEPTEGDTTIINQINSNFRKQINDNITSTTTLSGEYLSLGVTLEDIRKLAVEQIELERLARTDGSYRQFGLSFFGEASKAAYDYRPTYIGGTYKNIAFTEVIQNSPSVPTGETSSTTPLGTYAGHGITGISNGRIGHIHCDDYGLIMLIACIMPDVYYSQGLDRVLTDSLQSDMWLPERVKLGMQPILNKEIYYAGNNGNDEGEDNYLWAYQNPFDYLRYMPNKIHGKIADSTNNTFFPYTQSRKFNSLPNWGRSFSEAKDVRKSYLFANEESAYSAQFALNIRAVRPLPYKAIPAQIIN